MLHEKLHKPSRRRPDRSARSSLLVIIGRRDPSSKCCNDDLSACNDQSACNDRFLRGVAPPLVAISALVHPPSGPQSKTSRQSPPAEAIRVASCGACLRDGEDRPAARALVEADDAAGAVERAPPCVPRGGFEGAACSREALRCASEEEGVVARALSDRIGRGRGGGGGVRIVVEQRAVGAYATKAGMPSLEFVRQQPPPPSVRSWSCHQTYPQSRSGS
jgi:hypothetical protein